VDRLTEMKISFYFAGDLFDLNYVTSRMGITPTETRTKDSFPPTGLAHTEWSIEFCQEKCKAVSILFKMLIDLLGGKEDIIRSICNEHDIEAGFVIVIHMENANGPEILLPREAVSFAASINAEIGFDLYCYE